MKKSVLLRLLSLVMTIIFAFGVAGCGQQEISDIIDIVDTVVNQPSDETKAPETTPEIKDEETTSPETDAQTTVTQAEDTESKAPEAEEAIAEDGKYTSKDDVALYIHTYGHLPSNFITKTEARKLGWEGGSLEEYAKGCSIGGDSFGNREGLLPAKSGRKYTECDIDTAGKSSRGAKRIVFSNDGLIYYTDDHYESFTLLYGEE